MTRALTRRRLAVTLLLCFGGSLLVCVLGPLLGMELTPDGSVLALLDLRDVADGVFGDGNAASQLFTVVRLPRMLAGAVVGAGLAAAGCVFQAVLRNPLAEPYTLGVSSGASLAALLALRLGLGETALGGSATGLAALAGAVTTVYIVWRLARVDSHLPPAALLLAGVVLAVICNAAILFVLHTASFTEAHAFVRWTMGGLEWIRYAPLLKATIPTAIGLVMLLTIARDLNALSAGSDAAASVGVDPTRTTTIGFFAASLAVGAGISIAGPIGFVGLLVPHVLRGIVGPDHRVLLPACMFVGAGFVVASDTVARLVLAPDELPVGVITAVIGGSFFLKLIVGEKSRARLWGG